MTVNESPLTGSSHIIGPSPSSGGWGPDVLGKPRWRLRTRKKSWRSTWREGWKGKFKRWKTRLKRAASSKPSSLLRVLVCSSHCPGENIIFRDNEQLRFQLAIVSCWSSLYQKQNPLQALLTYSLRREFIIEPIARWINSRRRSPTSWSARFVFLLCLTRKKWHNVCFYLIINLRRSAAVSWDTALAVQALVAHSLANSGDGCVSQY